MRVAEKTIELNFCSQLSAAYQGQLIWFGLTQKQEAKAGFDACTALGGRLFIFQFKASCHDTPLGRRFHLAHPQLVRLKQRCNIRRSVFYALPMVGTTRELRKNPDVLSQTWLLDVSTLPHISPPTTKSGSLRKNERHYLDMSPPAGVLHSDPVELSLIPSREFLDGILSDSPGASEIFAGDARAFSGFLREFGRHALGLVALP